AIGAEHRKPVVVHARDADEDMAAILRAAEGAVEIVLHSFSSGPAVFEAALAARAYFSFSGMVTFNSWTHDEFVTACPADRLLVETDAPYLAPYPHRGRRNEPAYLVRTAERVAQARGTTLDDLAELTSANAGRCFGPRVLTSETTHK
ncbi:MAG: TatD family hydrolase, partial [Gemmatimonadales bacterium]